MSQTYGNSVLRGGVVCTLTLVPKYVWTHARKLRIKGFIKGLKALLKLPLLRKKKDILYSTCLSHVVGCKYEIRRFISLIC